MCKPLLLKEKPITYHYIFSKKFSIQTLGPTCWYLKYPTIAKPGIIHSSYAVRAYLDAWNANCEPDKEQKMRFELRDFVFV